MTQTFTDETRPAGAKTVPEIAKELNYGTETVRKVMVTELKAQKIGAIHGAYLYSAEDSIETARRIIKKERRRKISKADSNQEPLLLDSVEPVEPVQMPQNADSMLIQISEPNRKYLKSIEMAGGSPDAFINRLIDSYRL
jgi:hypothetical protein